MQALVYKSTGNWYQLKNEQGRVLSARMAGKLKTEGVTSSNPIAVGDNVTINDEAGEENLVITSVLPRKNYINRVSPHNKNQHIIIAANLDKAVLFATLKDPKTSLGFIDRFLVSAEAYHIPVVIVFNKSDLYKEKEKTNFEKIKTIYETAGYTVMAMSIKENKGIAEIKAILKDKTTLLSGHSGVGKSSFLNEIIPTQNQKTKEVSNWSGKGMHTTTFAEMFDLPQGGKIIDTPGIRELGLVDISREELSQFFPEMRLILNNCRFNNCQHIDEPGCAVKAEVENDIISMERYISYISIRDTIPESKWK
ncbi:MAG: ribosome small subunit-dependent GTPase A [Ferruginibacter sp.]|nr:ribosome small subunit-dependent GTPase A [Chitinophagaceae bacterium]HQY17862.1 ribosome small subunit-dependent GTPase A [Ferruginibacter sp.]